MYMQLIFGGALIQTITELNEIIMCTCIYLHSRFMVYGQYQAVSPTKPVTGKKAPARGAKRKAAAAEPPEEPPTKKTPARATRSKAKAEPVEEPAPKKTPARGRKTESAAPARGTKREAPSGSPVASPEKKAKGEQQRLFYN